MGVQAEDRGDALEVLTSDMQEGITRVAARNAGVRTEPADRAGAYGSVRQPAMHTEEIVAGGGVGVAEYGSVRQPAVHSGDRGSPPSKGRRGPPRGKW